MAVTEDDLRSFNRFATERLRSGDIDTLEELLFQWRIARELQDVNSAIERGIADVDAGRTRPLQQFWEDFTEKHDIPPGT